MPRNNIYTAEFRESAVELALKKDQSVAKTARDLGVKESTLSTWVNKYNSSWSEVKGKENGDRTGEEEHHYEELKRLRKENSRLKEARDLLKKQRRTLRKCKSKVRLGKASSL